MNRKGKIEVSCRVCNKKMKKNNLRRHMLIHNGPKLTCNICGNYKTSRKTYLENHKISVHNFGGSSDKQCLFCKKQFPCYSNLELHYNRSHTKERPYFCNHCIQECCSLGDFNRHLKTHDSKREKTFTCNFCKKGFFEKRYLSDHVKNHMVVKPHKCEICSKQFLKKFHLRKHQRTHSKEKPYKCEMCEASFAKKDHLTIHTRIHAKEKPYACQICKKGFSQKCSLLIHSRTHTGINPFVCEICNVRFSDTSSLKYHIRTHTGEKPYSCNECGKTFAQSSSLKAHTKRNHGLDKNELKS